MRLYVVHGSHPCAAVEKAMSIKGLSYDVTEWPPTLHAPMQLALFGARTVPALKLDGEKISGSRAIMRRLDRLRPDPPLYPADATARARVEEAELWGDEVFQPIARELIWAGFTHSPAAMVSYGEHSRLPLPAPAIRAMAPAVARVGARLNRTDPGVARRDRLDRRRYDRRWGAPERRRPAAPVHGPPDHDDGRRAAAVRRATVRGGGHGAVSRYRRRDARGLAADRLTGSSAIAGRCRGGRRPL
jgi:glutathione S-transferase